VKGAFEKLRARVQDALENSVVKPMIKAQRITGGYEVQTMPLPKSIGSKIDAAREALNKAMAIGGDAPTGATSLEAGYATDSDGMTGGDALRKQSLPKKVFVKMKPVPLTGDQITKAASAALSVGAITGAEANTIATHVALNRGKHCSSELLAKIKGHVK
jgi:hypothetical protein